METHVYAYSSCRSMFMSTDQDVSLQMHYTRVSLQINMRPYRSICVPTDQYVSLQMHICPYRCICVPINACLSIHMGVRVHSACAQAKKSSLIENTQFVCHLHSFHICTDRYGQKGRRSHEEHKTICGSCRHSSLHRSFPCPARAVLVVNWGFQQPAAPIPG